MTLKRRLAGFLSGAAALYLTRVAALYVLARFFKEINLNDGTYAVAPAWLKAIADNSGEIADIFALGVASSLVALIQGKGAFKPKLSILPVAVLSVGAGYGLVKLLSALDEVRYLPAVRTGSAFEWIECLLTYCFAALWIRGTLKGLDAKWQLPISALLQALAAFLAHGEFSPTLTLNALLFGLIAVRLMNRHSNLLIEVVLCFGYTAGHSLLGSYPDKGAFYMSANLVSGGNTGLNSSVITAAILAVFLVLPYIIRPKEAENGI